jgi:predicted MPP superfamily phosphohydrolase
MTDKRPRRRLNPDEEQIIKAYRAGEITFNFKNDDNFIEREALKLSKSKQRLQDANNYNKRILREQARSENVLTAMNEELISLIKKEGINISTTKHRTKEGKPMLVLQLSDLHLNEIIDIRSNKYDFYVAAKRLKMLADETKRLGKAYGCKDLFIAVLGDLLNSDRRLDEILGNATNRMKATQLSVILLSEFLLDLNKDFNLQLAGVTGNEARAKDHISWDELLTTDSYDFLIYDTLRILFKDKKGIKFAMMQANEAVVNIGNKHILLAHGHQLGRSGDMQKKVQETVGRYTHVYGINIDYVLSGHIHSAYICDYFARNSSLAGSNAYSEEALNYVSRASQNVHVFDMEKDLINSFKIDVNDVTDVVGYPMEKDIDAYNAKSARKTKGETVVLKIVV